VDVRASPEACFALLSDLEGYPAWYPDSVREVQVLERTDAGQPSRARALLHFAYGPLVRDFDLTLKVTLEPSRRISLARVPHDSRDPEQFEVHWSLAPGSLTVLLEANLSVPRLFPVGTLGDSIAGGFAAAAARELSRSR